MKIIPIHKTGKNQLDPLAYRPIALIPIFLKSINIKIKELLTKFIETNKLISDYSFGFKQKTSAINCVNALISNIHEAKRQNEIAIVTFLDLSKAFDNVDLNKLLNILV